MVAMMQDGDRGEHGVGGRRDEDGGIGCCGCGWLTTYKFHFAGRRQLIDDSIRPWMWWAAFEVQMSVGFVGCRRGHFSWPAIFS